MKAIQGSRAASSRKVGRVRSYWRSIASALLLGVAAPVSAIAGWARAQDRVWWLGAAGVSACLAGLLQLGDRPRPSESPSSSATLGSGGGQSRTSLGQYAPSLAANESWLYYGLSSTLQAWGAHGCLRFSGNRNARSAHSRSGRLLRASPGRLSPACLRLLGDNDPHGHIEH